MFADNCKIKHNNVQITIVKRCFELTRSIVNKITNNIQQTPKNKQKHKRVIAKNGTTFCGGDLARKKGQTQYIKNLSAKMVLVDKTNVFTIIFALLILICSPCLRSAFVCC